MHLSYHTFSQAPIRNGDYKYYKIELGAGPDLFQSVGLVGVLPGERFELAAEVAVGGCLSVNGAEEVEHPDDSGTHHPILEAPLKA